MKKLKEVGILVAVLILPFVSFDAEADQFGGEYECSENCKGGFNLQQHLAKPVAAHLGCGLTQQRVLYALPGKQCNAFGPKIQAHYYDSSSDEVGLVQLEVIYEVISQGGTRKLINYDVTHKCGKSWHEGSWGWEPGEGVHPK